jgi:hypothetical protein
MYLERGWHVIPVPAGAKHAGRDEWQQERWTAEEVPRVFAGPGNISLLSGVDSANTADVDCDHSLAKLLAPWFLPPTEARFGRTSVTESHRLYTVEGTLKTHQFRDPTNPVEGGDGERTMLVELRWTGAHTLIPPSTYPEGEPCVWYAKGDPAPVTADALLTAVTRLAGTTLIARHWPAEGSRHDAAMALAGALLRGGWDDEETARFFEAVVTAAGDDEREDRLATIPSTRVKLEANQMVTGWTTLGRLIDPRVMEKAREWLTPKRLDPGKETGGREPAQATMLVDLAHDQEIDLFHDASGAVYATIFMDGHWETWPLSSGSFRRYLSRAYYLARGKAPGSQAIKDATDVLAGEALFAGPERSVEIRLAATEHELLLDLGTKDWQIVRIDRTGWTLIPPQDAPVRFRRPRGLLPLPLPVRGGSVELLRPYVNCADDEDWYLVVGWLIGCLYPHGPRPILQILGEQGSAKSTLARLLRSLVDPNQVPLRSEPKEEVDLLIQAVNGLVVAIDNVSSLKSWLSDAFCRIATGGGISKRELFTDADEMLLDARRPVIFTGINDIAVASDLLDRCVTVVLKAISSEERRTEQEVNQRFARDRPKIVGALLDAAAMGLCRLPTTTLTRHPRMADFCRWVEATAPAFGWEAEEFVSVMEANRRSADAIAIEALPIGPALIAFMTDREQWEGTASVLLTEITATVNEQIQRSREWPKRANALSGQLRRLAPNLRHHGLSIELRRKAHTGQRMLTVFWNTPAKDCHHRHHHEERPELPRHARDHGSSPVVTDRHHHAHDRHPSSRISTEIPAGPGAGDDGDNGSPQSFFIPAPSIQTDFGDDMEEVTL